MNDDIFEKAYFDQLNKEEVKEFENRCIDDPPFAKAYQEFCATMDVLDTLDFQNDVAKVIEEEEAKSGSPYQKITIGLLSVAAVLLLIAFSGVFDREQEDWNLDNDLVAFPDLYTFRDRDSSVNQQLYQTIEYYNAEDYESVIARLSNNALYNDTLSMYLGVSYLKTTQYAKALEAMKEIKAPSLSEEVLYYSGVSHYLMGDNEQALKYWRQLPTGSQYLKNLPFNVE